MEFQIPQSPTGAEFIRAGLPYLFAALVVFAAAVVLWRSASSFLVARVTARGAAFIAVGFCVLIGVVQILPHNHGHVLWISDGSPAVNHAIETVFGLMLCAIAFAAHRFIWRRAVRSQRPIATAQPSSRSAGRTQMSGIDEYVDGVYGNSKNTLARYRSHVAVLRTLESCYTKVLPALGQTSEGAAIFAGMSHAAFLAGVQLATGGQIPPSFMVFRGCLEDALYGFYLFHHPELKPVWMARHDSEAAKKKVRDEFPIGRMKKFLTEKQKAVGEQFGLVYDATIDLGAHPNTLAFTSHLTDVEGSTDQVWQYINLATVDVAFSLRIGAMAALNALNIFYVMFPDQFHSTGATPLLLRAHEEVTGLPDPGSDEEGA